MKKSLALCAIAATITSGFSGVAQAVPVYFDFTGTISGTGSAISGGFNFDTDRLLFAPPALNSQYTFVDWHPEGLTEPLAFLDFDGRQVRYPVFDTYYNLVSFVDQCSSDPCPGAGDNFNLMSITNDTTPVDFTGTFRSSSIMVFAFGPLDHDYVNGSTALPIDIVTLPLHQLVGIFSESEQSCVLGVCSTVHGNSINFTLDTVSRGVGARSVPEPGTLGLFGVALAGMWVLRRRRQLPLFQR